MKNTSRTKSSGLSRAGARRAGDEYQDIVAIEMVVDLLERPTKYTWIRVEATEAGSLDDVIARLPNGEYIGYQVKFATQPQGRWGWDDLLSPGQQGGSSLIKKWFTSWERLCKLGKLEAVGFRTNGQPKLDLARCISREGFMLRKRIPDKRWKELKRETSSSPLLPQFLAEFSFHFNEPGLVDLNDAVRRRFFRIGGDEGGWVSLQAAMRRWVMVKKEPPPDGRIDIAAARLAAGWYRLRELPQGFLVPRDFVLPSQQFHRDMMARIRTSAVDCIVVTSPPGVGKSTYLSYLTAELRRLKMPVIRHHYFLATREKGIDRFDHHRVIESLMAELRRRYPRAVGHDDAHNPMPSAERFVDLIRSAGIHFNKRGQRLLIIVDGLDHVSRMQKDTTELNKLFNTLLPPEPGICVIVGTQPVHDELLPQLLVQQQPRENWIHLPLFTRRSIRKWIEHHKSELKIPRRRNDDFGLEETAEAFQQMSRGHPLIMKYSMLALMEQGVRTNRAAVLALPHPHRPEITDYYRTLWSQLPPASRAILCLLAACPLLWPEQGIIQCLSSITPDQTILVRSLRTVRHLLNTAGTGVSTFHPSLHIFVRTTEEFTLHVDELKRRALDWLRDHAPLHLRWAHEWMLDAENGNTRPLVSGPQNDWVIESLIMRYSERASVEIISSAGSYALRERDLSRYLELALLKEYHGQSLDVRDEAQHPLLEAQLRFGIDPTLPIRLSENLDELNEGELLVLARYGAGGNNQRLLSRIIHSLGERVYSRDHGGSGKTSEISIRIAARLDKVDGRAVVRRLNTERRADRRLTILKVYCDECRTSQDYDRLRALLKEKGDLSSAELRIVLRNLVILALETGVNVDYFLKAIVLTDSQIQLFRQLRGFSPSRKQIPRPHTRLFNLRPYEIYDQRELIVEQLLDTFFGFAYRHFTGSDDNRNWISQLEASDWIKSFLIILDRVAADWCSALKQRRAFGYGRIFSYLRDLPTPDYREEADFRYNMAVDDFALHASFEMLRYNGVIGHRPQVRVRDLKECLKSSRFNSREWIRRYLDLGRTWATLSAVEWLVQHEKRHLRATIEPFNDRANAYTDLAVFASRHSEAGVYKDLVRLSATNLMGYGAHKDMLLTNILDTLEANAIAGSHEVRDWVTKLSSLICNVDRFTDGDETKYTPRQLGALMLNVDLHWFKAYYGWLLGEEEYYTADSIFHDYLEHENLETSYNQLLARTAVDEESLKLLDRLAIEGNTGAQSAIATILETFGPIDISDEEQNIAAGLSDRTPGKHSPDPTLFPPNKLSDYRAALGSDAPYEIERPLILWLDHWTNNSDPIEAIQALESSLDEGTYRELRDSILEKTIRYCSRESGYVALCKAFVTNAGWSRFYSGKEKTRRYWEILKSRFPERWFDFILQTMKSPYGISSLLSGSSILLRLVEYLHYFGQRELAEGITNSAVDFVEQLVSPLRLKTPIWMKSINHHEHSQTLLIQRLASPSGIVRERVCSQAGVLLAQSANTVQLQEIIFTWMDAHRLESTSLLPLFIFIKAKQLNSGYRPPQREELEKHIQASSILAWMLVEELYGEVITTPQWDTLFGGAKRSQPADRKFFHTHASSFVPPIYLDTATNIGRRASIPFVSHWENEWTRTVKAEAIPLTVKPLHRMGRPTDKHFVAYDTRMGEAYRSAFLRTIAWAIAECKMPIPYARLCASKACPLDLGLWSIHPQPIPSWFPRIEIVRGLVDTRLGQIWSAVERLWEQRFRLNDMGILTRLSAQTKSGGDFYEIGIYGVFQKVLGPEAPSLTELADWCEYPGNPEPMGKTELRYGGELRPLPFQPRIRRFADWEILPGFIQTSSIATPRWQWWRGYRGVWGPAPFLLETSLRTEVKNSEILFASADAISAKWFDWTCGLSEQKLANLPPATGECLFLAPKLVSSFEEQFKFRFSWLVRITHFHRKGTFEEFQSHPFDRILGETNIILESEQPPPF